MSSFTKFVAENVLYSIVNPKNVTTFKDSLTPFSFSEFLKNTNEDYTPTQYNDFYLNYLKNWYTVKRVSGVNEQDFIRQQYIALLKQITLNYSTNAERKFISNIDFNDPNDLEIVIPFYSRKIKSIVEFYKTSRDKTKNVFLNYKRKGTLKGVESTIHTNILDFLFGNQILVDSGLDYTTIQQFLDVEVEELVDTFGEYFNLPETPRSYEPENRVNMYTSNYNVVDADVFLNFDSVLLKSIFGKVFLKELGFGISINVNLSYDPFCSPNNPLGELIKRKTVGDVSPIDKIYYQQKLLEKFMGVDLHYIYKTTTGESVSGILVTAKYPSNNLLNVKNPSTATIQSEELKALKKIGLYFRPDHQGILKFDTRNKQYRLNTNNLTIGKVYVYPDPDVYGNVQTSSETPIVYDIDYTQDIKYISSTFSYGDPKIETTDQAFYAYTSRQQKQVNIGIEPNNFLIGASQLYNKGYTVSYNTDIYGNQYFLQKSGVYKNVDLQYSIANTNSLCSSNTFTNKIIPTAQTIFSTPVSGRSNVAPTYQLGELYVKNVFTGNVTPLSAEMQTTFSKYVSSVRSEVYNKVISFDVVYDSIIIQTLNYCVFETISYNVSAFIKPNTSNTYIQLNVSDTYNTLSNRIFDATTNKLYFYSTTAYSVYKNDNNRIVYPIIYSYDVNEKKLVQLFPTRTTDILTLSSIFSQQAVFDNTVIPQQVNIVKISQSTLSYNSYNNSFNLVYLGKDMNDSFYIFNYTFNMDNSNISFTNPYVVDTQGQQLSIPLAKNTSNFFTITSSNTYVNTITSGNDQALYKSNLKFTLNTVLSGLNTKIFTIDNSTGVFIL